MNYKIIYSVTAKMLKLLAIFLLFPFICSLIYKENFKIYASFLITSIVCFLLSILIKKLLGTKIETNLYTKEGFVIVALTWIIYSLIGALPLYFSGVIPSFIDAFFETVSGFTTTGASIITNLEVIPKSILFWRSFSHFIGGMGVIVFAVAILPRSPYNIHIMKAEVPGPSFGKVLSSMKKTAITLYSLYVGLTFSMFILLLFSKIGFFESLNIAFSTAGTGGFATKNSGIAFYNNDYVTIIVTIFMIIFSLNMNLIYIVLIKKVYKAINSEELKWFLSIIAIATILIATNIYYTVELANERIIDVLFTVSSIISTTGFTYINFSNWTKFAQIIILFLMICGGCAGSTSGGLKITRIIFIVKNTNNYIKKCLAPNKISTLKIENKVVENQTRILSYILLYMLVFSFISIILAIQINDFEEIFSLVLSTLNNIGPGFNKYGPMDNYANIPYFSKFILSISMLLGRLEIVPFIVLLSANTWRRKVCK